MKEIFLFKTTLDTTNKDEPIVLTHAPVNTPQHLLDLYMMINNELINIYEIQKMFVKTGELCGFLIEVPDDVFIEPTTNFEVLFSGETFINKSINADFVIKSIQTSGIIPQKVMSLIDIFSKSIKYEIEKCYK